VSIVVEDYHKCYGSFVAVRGLSFRVEPGEVLGLVGPNGAGKTTTLRALAGILRPTRGRLIIDGHDLARQAVAAKKATAYIPDEPKLFDQLTV
jgi:ABC-2 type transport system ATP-binding protein